MKSFGAKCDHFKLGVRTRVRAHLNLDVRGACVRPKKRSQLTPCKYVMGRIWFLNFQLSNSHYCLISAIKRTCSIKRPGLEFFKKSLLNNQYDLKNKVLNK